ncbi:hypothetical protein BV25DRAFT_1913284 [Artomyces pyxidatus]|uniref:Uncharacterized protein n=1 Tax=Artomyces pyxidatus TaxID=48021 RepID=A0ACB8TCL8_9AGAM|nr:hypothetical protein BV25DRAFT_1913284 [Artomyces pyxidatus]
MSLSALYRTSRAFVDMDFSEAGIVKALRTHARDLFDIRMIVVNTARSSRHHGAEGGYEIRRKDWEDVVRRFAIFDQPYWQSRMVYIENIPVSFRSTSGVLLLCAALLAFELPEGMQRVQNILYPPHFQDDPETPPKCKGFAIVTFSQSTDVGRLLSDWPWELDRRRTDSAESSSEEVKEVMKSGLRILPKQRWDELQEEYVSYRQQLLDQIAKSANVAPPAPTGKLALVTNPNHSSDPPLQHTKESPPEPKAKLLDETAPYPPNCVIFIRNVHPETNKTTIRSLFSSAFDAQSGLSADGLDYVDYNKGLDTCYLRLASQRYAEALVAYFQGRRISQSDALDARGVESSEKPVLLELLQGRKEELYWDHVPEKVRRQAVLKAITTLSNGQSVDDGHASVAPTGEGAPGRKRRKRHQ